MRKVLLFLCVLFTGAAWADVTQPTLTTDDNNPNYYLIKNYRSNKFAYVSDASSNVAQTADISSGILFYFKANGDGVSIYSAASETIISSSITNDTNCWYLKENPYNTDSSYDIFCISAIEDLSGKCWDDQGNSSSIGAWYPSENDYLGTSWIIEKVNISKNELDNNKVLTEAVNFVFNKIKMRKSISDLIDLGISTYNQTHIENINNASNINEMEGVLSNLPSVYVTAYNTNASKYMKVGDSQCSFTDSPSNYDHVIQLIPAVSAGVGFYLKGFRSKKYVGNTAEIYATIEATTDPDISFLIQKKTNDDVDYAVIYTANDTGAKYGDSYLNGYNCLSSASSTEFLVCWNLSHAGSRFTIANIEIPDYATLLAGIITSAEELLAKEGIPGYPNAEAMATLRTAVDAAKTAEDAEAAYNDLNAAISVANSQDNINYIPRTDRYYTIVNARGAMVYDSSHDASVDDQNDNANYLWYKTGSISLDDTNNLWGFVERDGHYYMYNVAKKQFAAVGHGNYNYGATWIFSDTPNYITLDAGINNNIAAPNVRVRATNAITGNSHTMSVSTSYVGPVITYDAQGDGGVPMTFYASNMDLIDEVTEAINELLDDPTPYRNALQTLVDGNSDKVVGEKLGEYAASDDYTTALANANTLLADTKAKKTALQNAYTALETAIAGLALNLPEAGQLLRIRSARSDAQPYLGSENSTANPERAAFVSDKTGENELSTIFYYDGTTLTNLATGYRLRDNGKNFVDYNGIAEGTAIRFQAATSGASGKYNVIFKNNTRSLYTQVSGTDYYTDAAGGPATPTNNVGYLFTLEEVESLPVTVTAAGMATLYAPVSLSVPSGVTAYTVEIEESSTRALLNAIEEIPAGTGVVIEAAEGSYSFSLSDAAADRLGKLEGSVATANYDAGSIYILAAPENEKPGFYKTTSETDLSLKGCKAYLPAANTAGAPAYVFGHIATGIAGVEAAENNAAVYKLDGRRVSRMSKGIYIVGGKKVIVE